MTLESIRDDFTLNPTHMNGRLYQDTAVNAWMQEQISDQELLRMLREIRIKRQP